MVMNISGIKRMVNGGIPSMEIHLPPNILRMGLLNLSAIRYMPGTMNSVIKNANAKPKMIVQDKWFPEYQHYHHQRKYADSILRTV